MELKEIKNGIYYIPNATNIGVIKDDESSVVLVDSGLDEETGKRIIRTLNEKGLKIRAIINTHAHADHCGGNRFIKESTGAKIYAPAIESSIIKCPYLEPFYLFSGASPIDSLQNKFLMAQPSDVDYTFKDGERLRFRRIEITTVPLQGHSPNQIGVEKERVLFCADSLFSEETIKKHKIPFFSDVGNTKKTLAFLKNSDYDFYVPSHAEPSQDITTLIEFNLKNIEGIEEKILSILQEKKTAENVIHRLCNLYGIQIKGAQEYFLMNTATLALLSYLYQQGKAKTITEDNQLFWVRN